MARIEGRKDAFRTCTDIFDERYYVNNKRLMCFLGQWPYQSVLERSIRTIALVVLSFSLLIPQTLKLIESWGEINIFVETFSPLITNVGFNIKLANTVVNSKKIKRLLDNTRENWETIRPLPEKKILQKYGEKGQYLTIFYFSLINIIIAAWVSMPMVPILMDHFIPLNESRPHLLVFQTDYKIDPDQYFYSIYIHGSFTCAVCMQMFICHDTLFMCLAQHSAAMFEILRYRLENIIPPDKKTDDVKLHPNPKEDMHYNTIVPCLKNHKREIEFIQLMESSCNSCLFIIIGLNMLVMSCTGSRTVAKATVLQGVIRFAFYTVAQVVHLFCISLPGHWVMEASSMVRDSAYNCKWYLMSVRSRKLILVFIRQTVTPCTIIAGKSYVMSLENFCAVLQTSMSYFTMLTSMQ